MTKEWTLRELAEESGVPERTIRFYISKGILDPPLRGGRGAAYGPDHLARLREIRGLQAKGMMLAEIARLPEPQAAATVGPDLPTPSTWESYAVAGDVVVWVRADSSPWRAKHIRSVLREFASRVQKNSPKPKGDDNERD
jgi:DNA-binding transcriptional MerR regulator